jgi:hypothetical protein
MMAVAAAAVGVIEHSVMMNWRCPQNCYCHHRPTTGLMNKI